MQDLINTIQNSALASITKGASASVINAIGSASAKSGVDFAYLVQQAKAESNFNPDIKAKTSSATGLFQFINSTWMSMVENYGDKYGIDVSGKSKQEILDLRKDPQISANMAAEFASENERFLDANWGGDVGSTELYFAHFLGAPKAASFLNARDENPLQAAAIIFPKEAAANYNVFYEKGTGRAKSMEEVYAFFDKKFEVEGVDIPMDNIEDVAVASNENLGGLYSDQIQSVLFSKPKNSGFSPLPQYQLVQSPVELMILSQLELPSMESPNNNSDETKKNSLFYTYNS